MRKLLLLTTAIIFATITVNAQFKVEQGFGAGYSINSGKQITYQNESLEVYNNGYEFQWQLRFYWNDFTVTSDTFCYFRKSKGVRFAPYHMDYRLEFKYDLTDKFSFSYKHACFHPVLSKGNSADARLNGGFNKFSIKYNIK